VCVVSFPHRAGRGLEHADAASVQCGVYALHEVQLYAIRRKRETEIGVWCGYAFGQSKTETSQAITRLGTHAPRQRQP
jgi:hypothetical protein